RLAVTSDSQWLAVSSIPLVSAEYQYELRLYNISGNSDGEMENVYTVGQALFDAPSAWHPADASFSRDNTLLDVYLPDTSTIVTYKVDDIYSGETYVSTGGTTESSCLY
ncbi:unnamed protein product, partial [Ectocarpus sp. 12 AP-2014]